MSIRAACQFDEEPLRSSGALSRSRAEHWRAADCLQRSLRSRFRQQLTPGVSRRRTEGPDAIFYDYSTR